MYGTLLFTCVIVHVHVHVCIYHSMELQSGQNCISHTLCYNARRACVPHKTYAISMQNLCYTSHTQWHDFKPFSLFCSIGLIVDKLSHIHINVRVAYTATVMWVWSCCHDDVIDAGNVWVCQQCGSRPYRLSSIQLFQCLHHMCSSLWDKLGKTIASFPGLPHSRISQHSRKSVVHIKYSPDCFQAFPYSNTMS